MSGYKNSITDIDGNVGIGTTSPAMLLDVGLQGSAGTGESVETNTKQDDNI